ncbi:endo-1,4-beta-xylanase [Nitratireductor basaltis]|nr:endo-1,4-beta-xylanase [Nitratireductor basaltis]
MRSSRDEEQVLEEEPQGVSLQLAAGSINRMYGSAFSEKMLKTSSKARAVTLSQCASITPEWSLKWDNLAPNPDRHDFSTADAVANFARTHGKRMRGHTLLWHQGVPKWANAMLQETREWDLVRSYFNTVIPRYGDIIDEWDVINEPIEIGDRGDGLRQNQFMHVFGPDYIEWALWTARDAAPKARLYINEYGLEYFSPEEGQRRLTLLRLLERLKNRGAPIDGVGLQAHLDLRKGTIYREGVYGLMRDISDLGLGISITELDVRENETGGEVEVRDQKVADEVRRYMDIALQFPNVGSVTTWGLSDRFSWLRYKDGGRRDNRGLPYDEEWRRKPMRTALESAFLERQSMT